MGAPFPDLIKSVIFRYNNGDRREISQYCNGSRSATTKMWKCLPIVCFVGLVALASPTRDEKAEPIHIIRPPVRCPEGMKPDANGRCREVWGRTVSCPDGERPDEEGVCREVEIRKECDGEECTGVKKIQKRDVADDETETFQPIKKQRRMEALKSEKKSKKRNYADDGKGRSKHHAILIMLKKKKMQMMKPKPPPPPHHPPHHHPPHDDGDDRPPPPPPPEEEPATEAPTEAPGMYWYANELCVEGENSTGGCQPEVEVVDAVDENKEFKEWKPEKSSESSSSSSSSSSSDSTGESESENESEGETEDEVIEKAIKIKLMKLFRMRERYGPALRRWLITQLREYEDRKEKKEIISTRCLEAVKETMEVIKDNLEVEGLFTTSGNLRTRKKIQSYLSRGDVCTLRNWGFEFVVECAAALKIFLQNLPQPLIPIRIQQLVVAENSGVPEKTIANDALGLLKEEVSGRHKELLLEVFTFLKEAAVKVNTSELTGCNLPLKLLPVFFDIESNDPQKFRDIATVFHEIIMEAPEHLKTPCRKIPSGELKLIERILSQDMRMPSGTAVNHRSGRNQPTGENAEWRIPVPRVPHTRLHPWLGRVEHYTSA